MAKYESKEGDVVLFQNTRRKNPNEEAYNGKLFINGQNVEFNVFDNDSDGKKPDLKGMVNGTHEFAVWILDEDRRRTARSPNYTGKFKYDGWLYNIALWRKQSKNGSTFLSGRVDLSPDYRKPAKGGSGNSNNNYSKPVNDGFNSQGTMQTNQQQNQTPAKREFEFDDSNDLPF